MPRRKRSTWGCVQKVRPGVYRLRWWADTAEGRKRRSETFYGTRKQADHRMAEIRLHVGEDPSSSIGSIWADYVLPDYEADLHSGKKKPQTLKHYRECWEHTVRPRWAEVPVSALRPKDVQEWLFKLSNGLGERAIILLRAITAKAVFLELIGTDPMRSSFKLTPKRSRSGDVPDLAGLDEIWGICRGTWLEPAFLLCSHAGLRVGEAMGLKPGDVKWTEDSGGVAAVIHVERQVTELQKVELPKYKSVRYTVMRDPWATRLRECLEGLRPEAVWVMDDGASDPEEQPRRARARNIWGRRMMGTRWEGLTLQRLRPAFETYMHWEWKVPMEEISALMGHKSVAVTQTYDRPNEGTLILAALETARDRRVLGNT